MLTLCLSKGGKKFAKKGRMDMQHATVVSASPEPIASPSLRKMKYNIFGFIYIQVKFV